MFPLASFHRRIFAWSSGMKKNRRWFSNTNWCSNATINHLMELRLSRRMMSHEISRASSGAARKWEIPRNLSHLAPNAIKLYPRLAWLLLSTWTPSKIVNKPSGNMNPRPSLTMTETCAIKISSRFTIPYSTGFDLLLEAMRGSLLKAFFRRLDEHTWRETKGHARTFWR